MLLDQIESTKQRKWYLIMFFPMLFGITILLIQSIQTFLGYDFTSFGVYPRKFFGLKGIFFSPLLHGNFEHLFSNLIPLLIMGGGLFYYFKDLGYKIFFLIYLIVGLWVWASARPAYHIGSSGIVYGLFAFFIMSAILRKNTQLFYFALLVIFLYGSLIWGIFPLQPTVSFESHAMGLLSGIILAIYYRKIGIQKKLYSWEIDPESDDVVDYDWKEEKREEQVDKGITENHNPHLKIVYHYKKDEENNSSV